ncbi:hypothetical protein MHN79_20750 [Vibrio sp. Of14-4]|uniref:hypothetical protein n=1 Tax=Vibrio sp. Of14-4 TaxID=2724878 RepID=UPI001EF1E09F|nr:hypothetical protein [Vibrio sp. Of14-4]MCG7491902.1 hypothetical protein [Vibrio sp. Of14-4]
MNKRGIIFILLIIIVLVVILWTNFAIRDRKKYFGEIKSLGAHTNYSAPLFARDFEVPLRGKLGEMYDCLSKYRPTSIKRPPTMKEGPSGSFEIDVEDYKISLGIHNGEVTSASLTKYDQEGKYEYSSGTVAVNCNVTLLNQFD